MSMKMSVKLKEKKMEQSNDFKDRIQDALKIERDADLSDEGLQDRIARKLLWSFRQTRKMLTYKSISYSKIMRTVSNAFYKQFGDLRSDDGYESFYIAEYLDTTVVISSWEDEIYYEAEYSIKEDNSVEFTPRDEWTDGDYKFVAS